MYQKSALPKIWQERKCCAALCQTAPLALLSSLGTCRRSVWCPPTPNTGRCRWGWTGQCAQTGVCWTGETKIHIRNWANVKPTKDYSVQPKIIHFLEPIIIMSTHSFRVLRLLKEGRKLQHSQLGAGNTSTLPRGGTGRHGQPSCAFITWRGRGSVSINVYFECTTNAVIFLCVGEGSSPWVRLSRHFASLPAVCQHSRIEKEHPPVMGAGPDTCMA